MISVACPLMMAEPSTPALSLVTSMSSCSSTMSTISSTTSAIERAPSENTSSGCAPSPLTRTSSFMLHQRHQLVTVLHHVAAVRQFDLARVDLLQPRDQRQRHRLELRRAGAEHEQRGGLLCRCAGVALAASAAAICDVTVLPSARAMPFGSTIMITEPSPRMVLPENMAMWRSLLDIGLTTISSVWNTASTTTPKLWLPTWMTTMKPSSSSTSAVRLGAEQVREAGKRQQLVAQAQHRGVLDAFDAVIAAGARAHQFDDGQLRNGKALATGFDDQRRDDRQASAES